MTISSFENLQEFQACWGHFFLDINHLTHALTHPSVGKHPEHNTAYVFERLEFLGDRILGAVIAHFLTIQYPHESERDLSRRFSHLTDRTALAYVGRNLELQHWMKFEAPSHGHGLETILADGIEALLAATFLDAGLHVTDTIIQNHWQFLFAQFSAPPLDAKTHLQELVQAEGRSLTYKTLKIKGPPHAPTFHVQVSDVMHRAFGHGASRRAAEKDAARQMLRAFYVPSSSYHQPLSHTKDTE